MDTLKEFLTILSGLLTPVIACTTVLIAYRQYKIQRYRVRIDLFDRRLRLYNSIMGFLRQVHAHSNATNDQLYQLMEQTAEFKFLFKGEIKDHIDSLIREALELQEINRRLSDGNLPVGEERTKLAHEMSQHFRNLREQHDRTDELFSRYLKLDE